MENIIVRTKAQKLDSSAITAIANILNMNQEDARNFVWNAWCDPNSILAGLGLTLSETDAQLWVNELRYQFETRYPRKAFGIEEAFLKLAQKTNNFVASEIRGKILEYSYRDLASIRRAGYLLRSDLEKLYFGGIREIGFSKAEAERLKPTHCQISALYEEVMTGKYPEYQDQVEEENSSIDKRSSKESAEKESTKRLNNSLTADVVISNGQIIESYYSIVEQLDKVGITPALLETKKSAVEELLKASKLFV